MSFPVRIKFKIVFMKKIIFFFILFPNLLFSISFTLLKPEDQSYYDDLLFEKKVSIAHHLDGFNSNELGSFESSNESGLNNYFRTEIALDNNDHNDSGSFYNHLVLSCVVDAHNLNSDFVPMGIGLECIHDSLLLHEACFQRIISDFTDKPLYFDLYTYIDAPAGSGLGTSSTLTVSILGAFKEWLKLPLGEYDLAKLAYEVEKLNLGLLGGKQDQYAATFG